MEEFQTEGVSKVNFFLKFETLTVLLCSLNYSGRANEHQIPAPEMPQWQKNRSTGGGGGGGGGVSLSHLKFDIGCE